MFLPLALIAIAGGALVTYLLDDDSPLVARLCAGACIGFAALGLLGFILASFFTFSSPTLVVTAALLLSPLLLLRKASIRERVRSDVHLAVRGIRRAVLHPTIRTNTYVVFYALTAVLLWLVFDRAMIELTDGIYTGVRNNYGDLPFHLSIITGFTDGANFPPEDPTWAGARFTYPFVADFIAACFVRAGASLRQAIFLENWVLAVSLVGVLHHFALKLTRDWIAGLIAPVLVLFNGGLGWWHFFKDSEWSEKGIVGVLLNLEQRFTITSNTGYRWGNSLTTLFIPQRSILLGLPIAIIVFMVWWRAFENGGKDEPPVIKGKAKQRVAAPLTTRPSWASAFTPSEKRMAAAGAIAGLLPLVHAHSFLVVMMVGGCLALLCGLRNWRAWAFFFCAAILVAGPQMWWVTRGTSVQVGSFFGPYFGWDKGDENFFWFWFKNTGLFIPLLIASLVWLYLKGEAESRQRRLLVFYLPFTLCFFVPNLVKLAPWQWDNIKVIFYWFIASVPLVAFLLARLLRGRLVYRFASIVLLLVLTLAGMLDVWSVVSRATDFRIFDADGMEFADIVKQRTPPRATILHAPTYDTPIFLTGRRSVMGYPGHIDSHGIDYKERLQDIVAIYSASPRARELLAKHGVEYVVVGPHERREMEQLHYPLNTQFFMNYRLVGEKGEYRLYKIADP